MAKTTDVVRAIDQDEGAKLLNLANLSGHGLALLDVVVVERRRVVFIDNRRFQAQLHMTSQLVNSNNSALDKLVDLEVILPLLQVLGAGVVDKGSIGFTDNEAFEAEGFELLGLDIAGLCRQESVILGTVDSHHAYRDGLLLVVFVERILGIGDVFPLVENLRHINSALNLAIGNLNVELCILDRSNLGLGHGSKLDVISSRRLLLDISSKSGLGKESSQVSSELDEYSRNSDISDKGSNNLAFLSVLEARKKGLLLSSTDETGLVAEDNCTKNSLELGVSKFNQDLILGLLRDLGGDNVAKLEFLESVLLVKAKGRRILARHNKSSGLRLDIQDVNANNLTSSEVFMRILDISFTHLGNGDLHTDTGLIVGLDDRGLRVNNGLLQGEAHLLLGQAHTSWTNTGMNDVRSHIEVTHNLSRKTSSISIVDKDIGHGTREESVDGSCIGWDALGVADLLLLEGELRNLSIGALADDLAQEYRAWLQSLLINALVDFASGEESTEFFDAVFANGEDRLEVDTLIFSIVFILVVLLRSLVLKTFCQLLRNGDDGDVSSKVVRAYLEAETLNSDCLFLLSGLLVRLLVTLQRCLPLLLL
ncbi:hypothetical protein HG530_005950 [Fusarium avenaceum]|nr:hypothetical protein HG530_005950 [Fusarium avenaceum]